MTSAHGPHYKEEILHGFGELIARVYVQLRPLAQLNDTPENRLLEEEYVRAILALDDIAVTFDAPTTRKIEDVITECPDFESMLSSSMRATFAYVNFIRSLINFNAPEGKRPLIALSHSLYTIAQAYRVVSFDSGAEQPATYSQNAAYSLLELIQMQKDKLN